MSVSSTSGPGGVGLPDPASADPATPTTPAAEAAVVRGSQPGRPRIGIAGTADPRHALGEALTNDRRGVVSEDDAKDIVESALGAIADAADPREVFEGAKRVISAARLMLGSDVDAGEILDSYEARGLEAVRARLEVVTGEAQLPVEVKDDFLQMLEDVEVAEGPFEVNDVQGDKANGFTFEWTGANGAKGTGFIVDYDGDWFMAPKPVAREVLDKVAEEFKSYFDEHFAEDVRNWGATDADVAEMRQSIGPTRMLFPGESDPYDFNSTYSMTFEVGNPTGTDHGFFAGFDAASGSVDAYDFN